MMSQERLRQLFIYNPYTGLFTYRIARGKCVVGKEAGTYRHDGYCSITIDREQYLAHRLAWLYVYGRFPDGFIDHIDCNKSNNRISNLREATRSQNQHNNELRVNNSSGSKGVAWDNDRQKWIVVIGIGNKSKFIGRFDDLNEATNAATQARIDLHKDFARHE